tara:strand:- start:576 stop:1430 length:855 start_codon:yes stop_codon:yes gene_type:complete
LNSTTAILQLICPDRPGLVSELATWVANHNGNILHADHHTDQREKLFLSRIEWDLINFSLPRDLIHRSIQQLAIQVNGTAELNFSDEIPKVAILVSKQSHCLLDLLLRVRSGEIRIDIPVVISNHRNLEYICQEFSIDFKYVPVDLTNKSLSEEVILNLLKLYQIDLVVLAKYMQILSKTFIQEFPTIINIHHSFLPAFKGAKPYHQAWKRGVKVIGATAHYVTAELDDGPIIEQTIAHITHRDEVDDLIRKGRDTERMALAAALRFHIRRQVMVYSGKTAIFD